MSDVYDLDNAGSGFSLDAEDDLEALMAEAEAGIEPDDEDEDTSSYFSSPTTPDRVFAAGPASDSDTGYSEQPTEDAHRSEPTEDVQTDESQDVEPVEELTETEPTPQEVLNERESEDEPGEVDSDLVEEPTAVDYSAQNLDAALVARILRISTKYRELSDKERRVVTQFINNGEVIEAEEDLVLAVLNADSALTRIMRALHEARGRESIDRAFYVIELDETILRGVGSLMAVFGNPEIPTDLPHSKYAREVVLGIDLLDDSSMELVTATESVLSAGEVVSD